MRRILGFVAGALIGLLAWSLPALAEGAPKKYLSAASLNPVLVMTGTASTNVNGGVVLKTLVASNSTATAYYLKLYNKGGLAPVCGTDVPVQTILLPAGQTVPIDYGLGEIYPLGLGFCITGAIGDNDTTNAAAGVAVNLSVSGR